MNEDLVEVHRYMSAAAKGEYDLPGLFAESAFDEDGNLRHIELQNLSEILGSKCNSLLLANGILHYTMYVLENHKHNSKYWGMTKKWFYCVLGS